VDKRKATGKRKNNTRGNDGVSKKRQACSVEATPPLQPPQPPTLLLDMLNSEPLDNYGLPLVTTSCGICNQVRLTIPCKFCQALICTNLFRSIRHTTTHMDSHSTSNTLLAPSSSQLTRTVIPQQQQYTSALPLQPQQQQHPPPTQPHEQQHQHSSVSEEDLNSHIFHIKKALKESDKWNNKKANKRELMHDLFLLGTVPLVFLPS
jgi:hypothetical protein